MGRALTLRSSHPLILNPFREIQYKCGRSPNIEVNHNTSCVFYFLVDSRLDLSCSKTPQVLCINIWRRLWETIRKVVSVLFHFFTSAVNLQNLHTKKTQETKYSLSLEIYSSTFSLTSSLHVVLTSVTLRSSTCSDLAPVEEEKPVVETPKDPESYEDKSEIPPPPPENKAEPDESKALAIVEKTSEPAIEEKSKEDSVNRDAAENKAHKKLSAIGSWENTKKATVVAELKKIEEQLGKKKAEYVEQMKNKREIYQNVHEKHLRSCRSNAGRPGVISIFLDPILKLHTTHSWDFLKYQTALKIDSNLNSNNHDAANGVSLVTVDGSDTIIGILDIGNVLIAEAKPHDGLGSTWEYLFACSAQEFIRVLGSGKNDQVGKTDMAVASAATLVAAQCAEAAEAMGAEHDHLTSVVSSAVNVHSHDDITIFTAAAATEEV
ncbi:hypothetical protein ACFXTN_023731 [Malus domestica]